MNTIVRDAHFDSTLALLREGYNFVGNRCRRHQTKAFATRLLLKPVVCVMGESAARMFYSPGRFTRVGAMPLSTLKSLQDKGSVQTLDGARHEQRKRLFMNLMDEDSLELVSHELRAAWRDALTEWESRDRVELRREMQALLGKAACRWTGVPVDEPDLARRSRELGDMIEGAGALGPRNWRGLWERRHTEIWARNLIVDTRNRRLQPGPETPLHRLAWYREDGRLLSPEVAAVELLNLLRPTVAVARYLTFAALALHDYPHCRERLEVNGDARLGDFVQEVRRFYPFFPFIGGRVREAFDWHGYRFREGNWVLLDLYGSNHDEDSWTEPWRFQPERFRRRGPDAHRLIPQGAGPYDRGHRCAGEWLTIALIKTGVRMLVREMHYEVPAQDLTIDLSRIPAAPRSGLVIQGVKRLSQFPFDAKAGSNVYPFPRNRIHR